jgi:hypothetical protein
MSQPWTLATYRVVPGREVDFIKTWHDLAVTFSSLPHPPLWGVLIRSTRDPTLFHSCGPWDHTDHIASMRKSPEAAAAFKAIRELCVEMLPGDYELVAHVRVREK